MGKVPKQNQTDLDMGEGVEEEVLAEQGLSSIVCRIKELDYVEPPASLIPSVMESIRKRKLPWYVRFVRWATSPRSISFTPLHAGAFVVVLAVLAAVVVGQVAKEDRTSLNRFDSHHVPVVFSVDLANAHSVAVIGSFNQWRPQGFEMHSSKGEAGTWTLALSLPAGRHEYAFLVDGKKVIPDPHASLFQNDGFGNQNAVLILGTQNGKSI